MLDIDVMKYKNMIYKIVNKHYSKYLSNEDLFQEGCIGVMYAYESYNNNSNTEFDTWVYKCVKWQILRALRLEIKQDNMGVNICSLNTLISDEEDTELIEMIADNSIKYCEEVEDRIMYQFYVEESKRLLNGNELRIMLHFMENNYNLTKASEDLNISYERVRTIKANIRRKLYKSTYIRNRLVKIEKERLESIQSIFHRPDTYIGIQDRIDVLIKRGLV